MLDVHPPHEAARSWRSFFVHIATIVIGLFIAVSLEQTVEYFHHRHQRMRLEEQMHDAFVFNQVISAQGLATGKKFREYLVELRAAIVAMRAGKKDVVQPPVDDPRMQLYSATPSFAPYEAAKENGTVALLPAEEIRLYNRIVIQRDMYIAERDHWSLSLIDLESFFERFSDSQGLMQYGQIVRAPDLTQLTPAELSEYLALVTTAIKNADLVMNREKLVYLIVTAVLDGVHSEEDLVEMIRRRSFDGYEVPSPPPARP